MYQSAPRHPVYKMNVVLLTDVFCLYVITLRDGKLQNQIPRLIIPSPVTHSKVVSDRLWCGQFLNLVETTLTVVPVS